MSDGSNLKPFVFTKETILPSTDTRSPFCINLPGSDAKPIDNLISFFKYWKYFVKSLIHYFQDIALVKQFEANLSLQLISSVQFPGFKDLPLRIARELNVQAAQGASDAQTAPGATTPPAHKDRPNQLLGASIASSSNESKFFDLQSVTSSNSNATAGQSTIGPMTSTSDPLAPKRPNLFKTKSNSNTSFLKSASNNMGIHKRASSATNIGGASGSSQNNLVSHFTTDVIIPPNFYPTDSLFSSCAPILLNHHQHTYQTNVKLGRDLSQKLIPRLQILLRNLLGKIKEIRSSLKNELFSHTDISKEVSETGQILNQYMNAVERYSKPQPVLKKKLMATDGSDEDSGILDDPFLLKLQLDYQVKHQLLYESYMFASWLNLQNISKELFAYIIRELHLVLDKFGKLQLSPEMFAVLKSKIANLSSKDWEHFILMNPNFLNTYVATPFNIKREPRRSESIILPYSSSIHNKCLRLGILYRKNKLLKNYTRHFCLLTCNYLHEFKIDADDVKAEAKADAKAGKQLGPSSRKFSKDKIGGFVGHDDLPSKSYNLNDLIFKVKDERSFKFEISRSSNTLKKATFKCVAAADWLGWCSDLAQLCSFGPNHYNRFAFVQHLVAAKDSQGLKSLSSGPAAPIGSATTSSAGSTTADAASKTQASLEDVSHANQPDLSGHDVLSGMFTPTIRTPKQLGDENVFDATLLSNLGNTGHVKSSGSLALDSSVVSGSRSPGSDVLANVTASIPTSGAISLAPTSPGPVPIHGSSVAAHELEHESYMQMQQELLQKQQSDLKKLQQAPISTARAINLLQPPPLRRAASSDSVQSFEVQLSGIGVLVEAGNDVIHQVMENSEETPADSNIPVHSQPAPNVVVSNH